MKTQNLSNFEKLIVEKLGFSKDESAVIRTAERAGEYKVDSLFHIAGTVTIGEDYNTAPTVNIPLKATLALLAHRMGFQRDKALAIIADCVTDAILEGRGAAGTIAEIQPEVEQMLAKVETDVIDKLPRQNRKGVVSTKKLTVTKVEQRKKHLDLREVKEIGSFDARTVSAR